MKRRNTIDSSDSTPSSSILKYYYTYNTGTQDDLQLLFKEENSERDKKPTGLYRSNTFPMRSRDEQKYLPENSTITANEIRRRWSTMFQKPSKNKRNTLANIISTLTDTSPVLRENTDQDNKQKSFDKKWESIRSYKGKERANVEEEAAAAALTTVPVIAISPETKAAAVAAAVVIKPEKKRVTIVATDPRLDSVEGSKLNNKARANTFTTSKDSSSINTNDSTAGHDSFSITMNLVPIIEHFPEKQRIPANEKAIYFFLFGFLIFPLWWVGAWQYMREKKSYNDKSVPKNREVFPILNCLMSLVSLLLIGLVIGLSTVWAKR